jgi:histidinol-phosphate aminotransferase
MRIYEGLLREGVIVRPMDSYNFPTCLRVTIGTRDENRRFFEALDHVLDGAEGEGRGR